MCHIHVGDQIELYGKTRKGKSRLKRDGSLYILAQISDYVACLDGPGFGLISVLNKHRRWIAQQNDTDFGILFAKAPPHA